MGRKEFVIEFTKNMSKKYDKYRQNVGGVQCYNNTNILYIIKNPLNNLYKIGYTEDNLKNRFNTLRTQSGCDFSLEFAFNCEWKKYSSRTLEKGLHNTFSEKRKIGEWFKLNKQDIHNIYTTLKESRNITEVKIGYYNYEKTN